MPVWHLQENGDWQGAFPMPVRITSALNETLEDVIQSELCPRLTGSAARVNHCITVHEQPGSQVSTPSIAKHTIRRRPHRF